MKDDIVFALYKDVPIGRKDEFKRTVAKYIDDINFNDVFLRIVNYQVDKYDTQLMKTRKKEKQYGGKYKG